MTTSQADSAFSRTEEPANPMSPITDPSVPPRGAEPTETDGAIKQTSFAARHRAPTTKDVETNRWTGAAPGTLKRGTGGLHGGGVVPEGWKPEDGTVGGSTEGTGAGGSGVGRADPLKQEGVEKQNIRREEEIDVAGDGDDPVTGPRGHKYSDSGVGGVGDETVQGEEHDETKKKNPLKKIVDAIKNI